MKTSWRKLTAFVTQADDYLLKHKGETKTEYAIKRVRAQIIKYSEKIQERMADIEIDLCVVDDKEVIQRDAQGNLCFTREKFKERNQRQRAVLSDEDEYEVEPYFLKSVPANLTDEQLEAFTGLVIQENDNEALAELVADRSNGLAAVVGES
jgi:hypothetical protein